MAPPVSRLKPYPGARGRGFTLLELLVTVGIIALLAALLLPVLASARARAREAACTSHLSQLGKAMRMYLDDYGLRPPHLHELAQGYVSDRRLFTCPQDGWIHRGGWAYSAWARLNSLPEQWPFPVSYGYFFNAGYVDGEEWRRIEAYPGRPGYAVCVLHGRQRESLLPGEAPFFTGRTLRLCFDGSVVAKEVPSSGFHAIRLMTDQDKWPDQMAASSQ
jgi:prepilin-type N-terminal cleavage/methylation domain-containing protein